MATGGYGRKVIEALESLGLVTPEQIREACDIQLSTQERLGEILLRLGFLRDERLGPLLQAQFGVEYEPLPAGGLSPILMSGVPEPLARRHRIVPLREEGGALIIGTDSALNFFALDNLSRLLERRVEAVLMTPGDLQQGLDRVYGQPPSPAPVETMVRGLDDPRPVVVQAVPTAGQAAEETEAPIVKLVTFLITEAHRRRASDIHIEPMAEVVRVRYRIDGVLQEVAGPPKRLEASCLSRIKILAGLDIAERRLPQDGRIRLTIEGRELDLRVATLPSVHGETVVLRILDKAAGVLALADLGMRPEDRQAFARLVALPHGFLLVTGPTGSGKTTTLYAALQLINQRDRKMITVEDPVEYQLAGVNQVQVRPTIGLTFASGLRAILRQAPDVVMVGEIRDQETAAVAVQAALTGHLIFSTLHTNDAPGAVTRLMDMGVPPYLVASTVQAVLAQRLVRKVCLACRDPVSCSDDERQVLRVPPEAVAGATCYRARGCQACSQTGYLGRVGIFELLVMTAPVRALCRGGLSSRVVRERARELGMRGLRDDGAAKVLAGVTTVDEVVRVTADE